MGREPKARHLAHAARSHPEPDRERGLGEACTKDAACKSAVCAAPSADVGFTCSQACDASSPCPQGYGCAGGFCFKGVTEPPPNQDGGSSGGCAVAPFEAGRRPSIAPLAAIAAMMGAIIARKRRAR